MVTSTVTLIDAMLLSVTIPITDLSLSFTKYSGWFSDNVVPINDMKMNGS